MNYVQILVRTSHYAVNLSVTNSDRFLISEVPSRSKFLLEGEPRTPICQNGNLFCHLAFQVCWCQASDLAPYGIIFPFVLGISRLDCHFLRTSLTGYSKLKYFWSNDLPPFTHGFLNEFLLLVLWCTASTREVCTVLSSHSNVYGCIRTARTWGLAVILPDKQMYQQCSTKISLNTLTLSSDLFGGHEQKCLPRRYCTQTWIEDPWKFKFSWRQIQCASLLFMSLSLLVK